MSIKKLTKNSKCIVIIKKSREFKKSLHMYSEWLERKVGQVVLVVIDALRADFVLPENLLKQSGQFSRGEGAWPTVGHVTGNGDGGATGNDGQTGSDATSGLPRRPKIRSLHDLIEGESELVNAFLARANTPTVTLPRIKVSSKIFSGFVYVITNNLKSVHYKKCVLQIVKKNNSI